MEWRGEWGNGEGRQTWLTGPWRKTEIRICDFSCFFLFFAADPQRSVDVPLRQIESMGPYHRLDRKTTATQTPDLYVLSYLQRKQFFFLQYITGTEILGTFLFLPHTAADTCVSALADDKSVCVLIFV